MSTKQSILDKWFLRQDVINQLLESGEESEIAIKFAERIMPVIQAEESEYNSLEDPFDRSVALVLSLVKEQDLDPWNIDLSTFLKVFTKRVKSESDKINLPACGRLIRMAWEVLNQQAIVLFDRIQYEDDVDDWTDELDFGWGSDYDEADFLFTTSVLDGGADDILPTLFDERIRRDEGRPVTLGELLSAFKDAAEDAEELKIREQNRIAHRVELGAYLNNVGGRMHNEDLEGDIFRCWTALKQTCKENASNIVNVTEVINNLDKILLLENGPILDEHDEEAKIASFIASLFLTHRGFALLSQNEVPYGDIMLEDLWPDFDDFEVVKNKIEQTNNATMQSTNDQETGSVQFAKKRAEKLRIKEAKARKLNEQKMADEKLEIHEWLVE